MAVGWDKESAVWWAGACWLNLIGGYKPLDINCRFRRPTKALRTLVPPYFSYFSIATVPSSKVAMIPLVSTASPLNASLASNFFSQTT